MAINIGAIAVDIIAKNEKLVNGLKEANQKISGFASDFKKDFGALTAVAAGFSAGATLALKSFVAAAGEQEKAISQLALALKNAGVTSKEALQDQLKFASALQKTTTFADEQITSAQALIATFGATGETLKAATQATLDLAVAKRIDLNAAANLIGKAFVGETATLSRYGIVVADTIPKTERFAAVLGFVNKTMGGAAEADRKTFLGQMTAMRNALGEIAEKIGQAVIPILSFFTKAIIKISEAFQALPVPVQNLIGGITALGFVLVAAAAPILAIIAILPALQAEFALISGSVALLVGKMALLGPGALAAKGALTGFSALFSPMGLAIAAGVVALGFLISKFISLRAAVNSANEAQEKFKAMRQTIDERVKEGIALGKKFEGLTIKQALELGTQAEVVDELTKGIRGLATSLAEVKDPTERFNLTQRISELKALREEVRALKVETAAITAEPTKVKDPTERFNLTQRISELKALRDEVRALKEEKFAPPEMPEFEQIGATLPAQMEAIPKPIRTAFDIAREQLGQIISFAENPFIRSFQKGGVVPGFGSADKVPALLTPGETVLPRGMAAATNNFNITINNPVLDNRERVRELAKEVGEAMLGKMRLQERFA